MLNVLLRLAFRGVTAGGLIGHPQIQAQTQLLFVLLYFMVILPWQLVGVWRSSEHDIKRTGEKFAARSAQAVSLLIVLQVLPGLIANLPDYKRLYSIGFGPDLFGQYTIQRVNGNTILRLSGPIGLGLSEEVAAILRQQPEIKGVILDSSGGWTYEGRALFEVIDRYNLDTYTIHGCYSACTMAYMAGRKRHLFRGANLMLHGPVWMPERPLARTEYAKYREREVSTEIALLRPKGISETFLRRLFTLTPSRLWYPSYDELKEANVVHHSLDTMAQFGCLNDR